MTVKFAAYDEHAIYAVGDTADDAIAIARRDTAEPDAIFSAAPITDEFAREILSCWFGMKSFRLDRETGFLVETTND